MNQFDKLDRNNIKKPVILDNFWPILLINKSLKNLISITKDKFIAKKTTLLLLKNKLD